MIVNIEQLIQSEDGLLVLKDFEEENNTKYLLSRKFKRRWFQTRRTLNKFTRRSGSKSLPWSWSAFGWKSVSGSSGEGYSHFDLFI